MFADVEVKIEDQNVVAGFIRRTADAENSMPHLYADCLTMPDSPSLNSAGLNSEDFT